jgi:hypothetical protein
MSALIYILSTQHESDPTGPHVLRECDAYMQENAPHFSALGLVSLGASRVQDCGKHSNVRLKMIIIIISTHTHSRALSCLADKC